MEWVLAAIHSFTKKVGHRTQLNLIMKYGSVMPYDFKVLSCCMGAVHTTHFVHPFSWRLGPPLTKHWFLWQISQLINKHANDCVEENKLQFGDKNCKLNKISTRTTLLWKDITYLGIITLQGKTLCSLVTGEQVGNMINSINLLKACHHQSENHHGCFYSLLSLS